MPGKTKAPITSANMADGGACYLTANQTHPVKAFIVEVDYVSNTKNKANLKDKMAQHGKSCLKHCRIYGQHSVDSLDQDLGHLWGGLPQQLE